MAGIVSPALGQYGPLGVAIAAILSGISGILYQRSVAKSKMASFNKGVRTSDAIKR